MCEGVIDLFDMTPPGAPALVNPAVTLLPGWAYETIEPAPVGALMKALPLTQRTAHMYGRDIPVPRLECWFGSRPYAFGGRVEEPRAFTPEAEVLRGAVIEAVGVDFDSCFVNYYRTGEDSISWHADDDEWIGPVIGSLSLGCTRRFRMKPKAGGPTHEYLLGDGDLFVMHPGVQREWLHCVPKEPKIRAPRLNFTFRTTIS